MQHQSRTMLPLNRDLHGIAMTNLASEQSRQQQQSARFGGNSFGQARLPAGPSIDMLRRSKSQKSLTRKAAQGCVSSVDCRHCMAEGVASINSHIKQAADQQLGTGHCLQRPHIERRGGLNSTGYRSSGGGGAEGGFREAAKSYRQCRGLDAQEINQRVPHCPQTGMRTAPTERARKHCVSNDENACRCSAVGGSVTPNTNQARLTNQLSTF